MSDEEMDRQWQAGRSSRQQRPQSTVARAFSASLDELFKIDNSIADLDAAVTAKKQAVTSQTSELEALEARLRATEERLKNIGSSSTTNSSSPRPTGSRSPRERPSLHEQTFQAPSTTTSSSSPPEQNQAQTISYRPKPASRPGTAGKGKLAAVETGQAQGGIPPLPGQLPPTPGTSEGESEEEEEEEEDDDDDDEEETTSEEDEEITRPATVKA